MRLGRIDVGMMSVIVVAGLSLFVCPGISARERAFELTDAPAGQTEAVVTNLVQARQWTRGLAETDRRMRIEGVVQGVFPQTWERAGQMAER